MKAIDFEDFFGAVDDPEPALVVVNCYVPGLEEAFAVKGRLGGAFISPVAEMGDLLW